MKSISKWMIVGACGVVTGTAVALAQEQNEEKQGGGVAPAVTRGESGAGPTTKPLKIRRGFPGAAVEAPTEEEWRAVVELMGRYSPNRLKAIEEQGAQDGSRYEHLRKMVFVHYRELALARERGDQELYDLKLQVVQKDDEVWALQRQMREAADQDRPVLRYQLRQRLNELVRMGLKERELRIARLERSLAEEKARLEADQKNIDERVAERFQGMTAGLRSARPVRPREEGGSGAGATTSQVR